VLPLESISEPSLVHLAPGEAPLAYLQAAALVDQIAVRGGDHALRVVLAQLFRSGDLDRALLRAIGLDTRALEAATFAELGLRR
jgi:hypothetical protein